MIPADLNSVLEPVSADAPCGPDLEYDAAFGELERMAEGKPEQQMGDTIVPAQEPDWKQVQRKAIDVLKRSKDLRPAVHLTRSLLRTDTWAGLAEGLTTLQGLVEQYWEGLYPALDPDDDNDPTMRLNILATLSDTPVLNAVRNVPLVSSRTLGRFSLKDLDIANNEAPPDKNMATPPTMANIDGAAQDCDLSEMEATHGAVTKAAAAVAGLEKVLSEKADAAPGTFGKLAALLRKADNFLAPRLAQRNPDAAGGGESAGEAPAPGASAPVARGGGARGPISSREDVTKALDEIAAYYAKYEPASPIPLFMARCKRLVMMSFFDLVKELAPDGLQQVQVLVGQSPSE
ncbi:MAG TPA: type VI secretion system protein TssA [Polyangia bacterium]|jgi:type VI secretion system protein ImpA|nr:type VI secretion system protein TssA [Polyangia bacterium]